MHYLDCLTVLELVEEEAPVQQSTSSDTSSIYHFIATASTVPDTDM